MTDKGSGLRSSYHSYKFEYKYLEDEDCPDHCQEESGCECVKVDWNLEKQWQGPPEDEEEESEDDFFPEDRPAFKQPGEHRQAFHYLNNYSQGLSSFGVPSEPLPWVFTPSQQFQPFPQENTSHFGGGGVQPA